MDKWHHGRRYKSIISYVRALARQYPDYIKQLRALVEGQWLNMPEEDEQFILVVSEIILRTHKVNLEYAKLGISVLSREWKFLSIRKFTSDRAEKFLTKYPSKRWKKK